MKTQTRVQLVALVLAFGSMTAVADPSAPPPSGESLPALLEWSETHQPMIAAMQAEASAKRQQTVIGSALDDPMLGIEWRDIDSSSPTLNPSRVGSMKYSVKQMLPLWGKRDLKRRMGEADAAQADYDTATTRAEIRANIRQAWSERYRAQAEGIINDDIARLLQQMELAARQRYQIGQAGQADLIRLQTELSMLRNEQLMLAGKARQAQARLAGWLNLPPAALTGVPDRLPQAPQLKAEDWLQQALAGNPQLLATQKAGERAETGQQLALLNKRPGLTVGLAAIQMESRITMFELMLEMQIPLQGRARQAERDEAAAMLSRTRLQQQAQRIRLESEAGERVAMLDTARAQAALLDTTLAPQAELGFQSALAAYQTGKGEFASLLEAQQQIRRVRQMRLMAELDQFQAWTGLLTLAGDQ